MITEISNAAKWRSYKIDPKILEGEQILLHRPRHLVELTRVDSWSDRRVHPEIHVG